METPASDVGFTLLGVLRVLWENRGYLAKVFVAGLVGGCLVAFLIPARYQSTVQLMPPDNQSSSGLAMLAALTGKGGGAMGAMGGIAGDVLGIKSSGALFVGVLRSRTVSDRVVERFGLKKIYGVRFDEDARDKLSENMLVSEDRKSGIISIAVTDRNPQRAAAMAQACVEELDRLVSQLSTSAAHRERVFLEGRLTAVKQELDRSSTEFSQFASKNTAIDIKEQGKAMVEAAATLMGQLIAAESQLKGLEEIYTPDNVRVRSVEARIAELHKQLEKMGGKEGGETNGATETDGSMYPSIRKLPLLGVTYADLFRQTKIQEAVYETLTQEYELAKVQEAKETPSVKVLDVARIPEKKSYPPRLLIMIFCGFLALTGGMVLNLGRVRWSEVDAQDPRKVFAQEVIQTVDASAPWAAPNGSRLQAMSHRVWLKLVRR
jgi:uncharacterized protein involved in exopolysaccharide biosynthesis